MEYECLKYKGRFLVAKPKGWQWSDNERTAPFSIHAVGPLILATVDYLVNVSGEDVFASKIDPALIVEAI